MAAQYAPLVVSEVVFACVAHASTVEALEERTSHTGKARAYGVLLCARGIRVFEAGATPAFFYLHPALCILGHTDQLADETHVGTLQFDGVKGLVVGGGIVGDDEVLVAYAANASLTDESFEHAKLALRYLRTESQICCPHLVEVI